MRSCAACKSLPDQDEIEASSLPVPSPSKLHLLVSESRSDPSLTYARVHAGGHCSGKSRNPEM